MWISLDTGSGIPLSRQIYQHVKEMILTGTLMAGEKLPSTRALSLELSLSRNTVLEAYDQLIAEGYLEGRHGFGTLVASGIHQEGKLPPNISSAALPTYPSVKGDYIDFRSGVPALEYFPRKEWAKLYQNICYNLPEEALRYHSPAGASVLRNAISSYLLRTRGIHCDPADVMIVSGSTQGLSLISALLVGKPEVIVEDPLHPGLLGIIAAAGYQIISIPADENGLNTDYLKHSPDTAFIYTTPSHQYPLGGILPIQRRQTLVRYAIDNDCYIVEDDYDSEFRFEGPPVSSLYELELDRVIYLGSFSKILAPALRLGFLLLPKSLRERYRTLKMYSDVHTEALSQYVLAEFIQSGGLEKHIWKMKKCYHRKRNHLLQELEKHFPGEYEIMGHAAGLHLVVRFANTNFSKDLIERIYQNKVKVYPVEDYAVQNYHLHENEVILGYSHLSFEKISEGIQRLSEAIKKCSPATASAKEKLPE